MFVCTGRQCGTQPRERKKGRCLETPTTGMASASSSTRLTTTDCTTTLTYQWCWMTAPSLTTTRRLCSFLIYSDCPQALHLWVSGMVDAKNVFLPMWGYTKFGSFAWNSVTICKWLVFLPSPRPVGKGGTQLHESLPFPVLGYAAHLFYLHWIVWRA